jgi:hypothetical protein
VFLCELVIINKSAHRVNQCYTIDFKSTELSHVKLKIDILQLNISSELMDWLDFLRNVSRDVDSHFRLLQFSLFALLLLDDCLLAHNLYLLNIAKLLNEPFHAS